MRRFACVLLFLAVASPGLAGELEGRWKLVEQRYESGRANHAANDAEPVRLELVREGAGLAGRIWTGDNEAAARSWPALVSEGEARAVRVDRRSVDALEREIEVRYEVPPAPGDDLTLVITESYRVVEEGRALVGTVAVAFVRGGEPRGGYTLHRRFERER